MQSDSQNHSQKNNIILFFKCYNSLKNNHPKPMTPSPETIPYRQQHEGNSYIRRLLTSDYRKTRCLFIPLNAVAYQLHGTMDCWMACLITILNLRNPWAINLVGYLSQALNGPINTLAGNNPQLFSLLGIQESIILIEQRHTQPCFIKHLLATYGPLIATIPTCAEKPEMGHQLIAYGYDETTGLVHIFDPGNLLLHTAQINELKIHRVGEINIFRFSHHKAGKPFTRAVKSCHSIAIPRPQQYRPCIRLPANTLKFFIPVTATLAQRVREKYNKNYMDSHTATCITLPGRSTVFAILNMTITHLPDLDDRHYKMLIVFCAPLLASLRADVTPIRRNDILPDPLPPPPILHR